jgi:hypothetical protein
MALPCSDDNAFFLAHTKRSNAVTQSNDSLPDPATLTTRGLAPTGQGRILLIACGALAHEILALKRANGWDHMDLHCLPAKLHLYRFAEHDDEITAFYLTDFLVRQFDAFVWKPMGLDRHPELRDVIFGNYTKLVYQAQTDDAALRARAEECAQRLGLDYEYRFTGYGDLHTALAVQAAKS